MRTEHPRQRLAYGFLSAAAILLLLAGVTRAQSQAPKGSGQVVVASLGGGFEQAQRTAMFEPFERETGIKVVVTAYTSLSQMKAQVQSGNVEWDTVTLSKAGLLMLHEGGLLEKVDYSALDKTDLESIEPQALIHPFGVPNMLFTSGIAYNTKRFPPGQHPKTWADFWDVKRFPGPRSLGGFSGSLTPDLEFALLADGVPTDKLYPLDIDRAFRSLDRLRPHIVKFWTTGAMSPQMLTDAEVVMASAYMSRIGQLKAGGAPVEREWNQGKLFNNYWVILKGAKNYDNAMRFIAFALRANSQASLSKLFPVGPINKRAFGLIPPELGRQLDSAPENLTRQFVYNDDWWAANRAKVQERWNAWLLQK